jgi:flagellar basal-body rod protein FlgG
MLRSLSTAASGMHAQQARIDNIANNLANVNTTGFKKSRMEFQDLLYENLAPTGGQRSDGTAPPVRVEVGHGVRIVSSVRMGGEGLIEVTDNELDLVIQGDGFFQVQLPDGNFGYTRDGSFKMDRDRNIVTSSGYYLEPLINVPEDAISIGVSTDGRIEVIQAGDSGTATEIGQIEIARFYNTAGMSQQGDNLLLETPNSGTVTLGLPGEDGYGSLLQGALEKSNVDVARELVDMITAQRAYELNSRTIQTADDMLQTVNQIRR